jgi:hypothetical protein
MITKAKIGYNDQISLSKKIINSIGKKVSFDYIDMYDTETGRTIMYNALAGCYTLDDLLTACKKFYKNE